MAGGTRGSPLAGLGAGRTLDRGERDFFEPRFGRSFEGVRVHDGAQAARAARGYDARAYTVGQDIVFGRGEYRPGTGPGRELLAHELAHTVQQREGRVRTQLVRDDTGAQSQVSMPGDPLEREADDMASAVMRGSAPPIARASGTSSVQRFELPSLDDVVATGEALIDDPLGTLGGAAEAVAEELGIPTDILDTVNTIASALGGSVSVSGWTLTISVSGLEMPWALTFEPELDDIISADLTVPVFEWPIGPDVFLHGAVGVEIGLRPIVGLQLGPGSLNSLTLVIDARALSARLDADVEFTVAGQIGAEAHANAFGEVGLMVIVPPGIPIAIPVATIEAGLAAQIVGTAIATTRATGSARASLYGLSLSASTHTDLGLALGYGVGGYGSLSLLGVNLCTLYWPLWRDRKDTVLEFDVDAGLVIDASGLSGNFDITEPTPSGLNFDDLPLALPEHVLSDDCPLCDAAEALGAFPLDNLGGGWANWTPKLLAGPLANTYVRNPGFASAAECRGACGPDCFSCDELGDAIVCEDLGPAGTQLWLYERLAVCPTHEGCRQHDGGYDWCASLGENTIFGPCHRLPDFEAICAHGVGDAVGWIIGMPPHDADPYFFADSAAPVGIIAAPCPEDAIDPANPPRPSLQHELCLPDTELVAAHWIGDTWTGSTDNVPLGAPRVIPVYGPIVLVVVPYARGDAAVTLSATLGPVWLTETCVILDLGDLALHGTGTVAARAAVTLAVEVIGSIGADLSLDCLLDLANIEGALALLGTAELSDTLYATADVTVDRDGVHADYAFEMEPCLELTADLDAMLRLSILGFSLLDERWNLAHAEWERCWSIPLSSGEGAGAEAGGDTAGSALGGGISGGGGAGSSYAMTGGAPAAAVGGAAPAALGGQSLAGLPNMAMTRLATPANASLTVASPTDLAAAGIDSVIEGACVKPGPKDPCDQPLPIVWPGELPLPDDGLPLVRVSRGHDDFRAQDRGPDQARLARWLRHWHNGCRHEMPPFCFEEDIEDRDPFAGDCNAAAPYDAHHIHPLYLGGNDEDLNLCGIAIRRHQLGHRLLDNQVTMAGFDPVWIACGVDEPRLSRHPVGQEYYID